MSLVDSIVDFLKGRKHAGEPKKSVSGGDGCEHRIIYPFEAICEQAISDIGRVRMLAAACAAERSGDSGPVSPDPIRRESLALIAAARSTGDFVQMKDVPDCRLEFIGVTEDVHRARLVFRQKAVRSELRPDDGQTLVALFPAVMKSDDSVKDLVSRLCSGQQP